MAAPTRCSAARHVRNDLQGSSGLPPPFAASYLGLPHFTWSCRALTQFLPSSWSAPSISQTHGHYAFLSCYIVHLPLSFVSPRLYLLSYLFALSHLDLPFLAATSLLYLTWTSFPTRHLFRFPSSKSCLAAMTRSHHYRWSAHLIAASHLGLLT